MFEVFGVGALQKKRGTKGATDLAQVPAQAKLYGEVPAPATSGSRDFHGQQDSAQNQSLVASEGALCGALLRSAAADSTGALATRRALPLSCCCWLDNPPGNCPRY